MSEVFERNLERLLTRAYVAVRPSDECRARIEAAMLAALDRDRPRLAPPSRVGAAASRTPRRPALLPLLRPVLAAAALLLAVSAVWWLGRGPAPSGLERLLAEGHVAWRAAPSDDWAAWPEGQRAAQTAASSEYATPELRGLDVDLPPQGGVALLPSSQASVRRTPGEPLRIELSRGGVDVRRDAAAGPEAGSMLGAGDEWLVAAADRVVHLETGALSVALAADAVGGVSVLLWSGRAWLETPAGRQDLRPGQAVADGSAGGLPHWEAAASPAEPLVTDAPTAADSAADASAASAPQPDTLSAPDRLAGRALDASTAQPVGAYTLTLVLEDVTSRGPVDVARAIAAPDGRFEWSGIEPGSYALFAQAPGYATASQRGLTLDGSRILPEIELQLEPGGVRASGRVVEAATGAPVAGAVVLSESDAPVHMLALDASELPDSVTSRTTTREDGSFELDGLASGPQVLRATADGFAPQWITVDTQEELQRTGAELRLTTPAAVQGRVTLDTGAPAAGMFMIVSLGDRWPQRACIGLRYALTDEQGHYRIGDLPAEPAVVLMLGSMEDLSGSPAQPRVLPVQLQAGTTATIDFLGEPRGGKLYGLVVGAGGQPVIGQMISLIALDGSAGQPQAEWSGAMTDEQGGYEFGDLRPGRYELFLVQGAGASVVSVGAVDFLGGGDQQHDLRLPGASISGQLRDGRSGEPLPNGTAIVLALESGRPAAFVARVQAGADGRFNVGPLSAGQYRVQGHAAADGWGEALAEVDVSGEGGEGGEGSEVAVALDLFPGGKLSVLAVDENGVPLRGALVELIHPTGGVVDFAASQLTDEQGLVHVGGLSIGTWTLRVRAAGRSPVEQRVEVRVGEQADLRVALLPAG